MAAARLTRTPSARGPAYTLDDFPVGSIIMTPKIEGPPIPLLVIGRNRGEVQVCPPGEDVQNVSLLTKGVRPVTQKDLTKLELAPELTSRAALEDMVRRGDLAGLKHQISASSQGGDAQEVALKKVALVVRRMSQDATTLLHLAAGHMNANVCEATALEVLRYLLQVVGVALPLKGAARRAVRRP
jgi:hypothetical protein